MVKRKLQVLTKEPLPYVNAKIVKTVRSKQNVSKVITAKSAIRFKGNETEKIGNPE